MEELKVKSMFVVQYWSGGWQTYGHYSADVSAIRRLWFKFLTGNFQTFNYRVGRLVKVRKDRKTGDILVQEILEHQQGEIF